MASLAVGLCRVCVWDQRKWGIWINTQQPIKGWQVWFLTPFCFFQAFKADKTGEWWNFVLPVSLRKCLEMKISLQYNTQWTLNTTYYCVKSGLINMSNRIQSHDFTSFVKWPRYTLILHTEYISVVVGQNIFMAVKDKVITNNVVKSKQICWCSQALRVCIERDVRPLCVRRWKTARLSKVMNS